METENRIQEKRPVSNFSKLNFKAVGKIILTQGSIEELVIEAIPEICARIKTEVIDDTLIIQYSHDWKDWIDGHLLSADSIIFHLTMKNITDLSLSGPGNLSGEKLISDSMTLSLRGPGLIHLSDLSLNTLNVNLSGVGSIDLSGKANFQDVKVSGAGSFTAESLETGQSKVDLSGVGNARIWSKDSLEVNISGAGGVEYFGNPLVKQHISGVGMLKSLGNR